LVVGEQRDRSAITARRAGESGDVDALRGNRLGHLGELPGLVLEVHNECVHAGTSMATPTRTAAWMAAISGPVGNPIVPRLSPPANPDEAPAALTCPISAPRTPSSLAS